MDKLLPDIENPLLAPFWEGCQQHRLVFPHCPTCQTWQWYPTYQCKTCYSDFEWKEVSGEGKLFSWTVARKAFFPEFKERIPLIIAVVDMVDAPGVRLVSNIIHANPEDLQLDMELKVRFIKMDENIVYPQFEIVKG